MTTDSVWIVTRRVNRSERIRLTFVLFLLYEGPRWTSWNLGIFICIRCAGFHRNLGVHISKVKSVNLDSWTAEQIAVGNFLFFNYLFLHSLVNASDGE